VHVFDVGLGGFIPASQAEHAGTGPYLHQARLPLDGSGVPAAED